MADITGPMYTPDNGPVPSIQPNRMYTPDTKPNSFVNDALLGIDRSSKFDTGYNPLQVEGSQENYRSNNEGWMNKVGAGVIRFPGLVLTKTIGGVSDAFSALYSAADLNLDDLGDNLQNPFRHAIDSVEDTIKKELPIYKSDKYTEGNFWDKLSTAEF